MISSISQVRVVATEFLKSIIRSLAPSGSNLSEHRTRPTCMAASILARISSDIDRHGLLTCVLTAMEKILRHRETGCSVGLALGSDQTESDAATAITSAIRITLPHRCVVS